MIRDMNNKGWIEVITGCVFSGKTEELIRQIKQVRLAHRKVMVFRADPTHRKSCPKIVSHSGISVPALPITCATEIRSTVELDTEMVAVDEVQFLEPDVVAVMETLANKGIRVVLAGLDMDFRGEPFGSVADLLARADFVQKRQAVCVVCGQLATRSQRLINGQPAKRDTTVIMRGHPATYEPRCRKCHQVPG
jgi:thymidine kinase